MKKLKHQFVEFIPEQLEDGVLYVSIPYATVLHKCCCGCGREVVTPLTPTDWKMTYDGDSVSLHPSIGNWSSPCRSHYVIRNSEVLWAKEWSKTEITNARKADRIRKNRYFQQRQVVEVDYVSTEKQRESKGLLQKLLRLFKR